jgi:tetratricopeptide (TPR) repeat protein
VARVEARLARGDVLEAAQAAQRALESVPGHLRLRQLHALALARAGAPGTAREILLGLERQGARDTETLGLLARTAKDLGDHAADPAQREAWHLRALGEYRTAHEADAVDPWPGINAAVLALTLGRREEARLLALDVRRRCLARQGCAGGGAAAYWTLATLGEAALVLGELDEAERRYAEALRAEGASVGHRASTLKNARRVFMSVPGAKERIEALLRVPPVLVYAGHIVDRPGRPAPRFPPGHETAVGEQVVAALARFPQAVTFGSAAAGFDLLVLEEAQRRGFATHVVLPYAQGPFREDCVALGVAGDWPRRFEAVLARAASVSVVSPARLSWGGASIEYANTVVLGLARAYARRLESRVEGLALWDGKSGDGPGGTAWNVERWRAAGVAVSVLSLSSPLSPPPATSAPALPAPSLARRPTPGFSTEIKAVLFADVKGYSRLEEAQVPTFVRCVLETVGRLCDEPGWGLETRNTWGDGFHLVFGRVEEAGRFALRLLERVTHAMRSEPGLPGGLDLRVALHAGAVYAFRDPVTGQPSFGGAHVTWAARLEPVTPPGQVYATQWFAALAEARDVKDFVCEYVGEVDLPKNAGRHPTYVVRSVGGSSGTLGASS